jgi:hypothetical protein
MCREPTGDHEDERQHTAAGFDAGTVILEPFPYAARQFTGDREGCDRCACFPDSLNQLIR